MPHTALKTVGDGCIGSSARRILVERNSKLFRLFRGYQTEPAAIKGLAAGGNREG